VATKCIPDPLGSIQLSKILVIVSSSKNKKDVKAKSIDSVLSMVVINHDDSINL
jgi:hypothetical protein